MTYNYILKESFKNKFTTFGLKIGLRKIFIFQSLSVIKFLIFGKKFGKFNTTILIYLTYDAQKISKIMSQNFFFV